jgi:hypothetical protein
MQACGVPCHAAGVLIPKASLNLGFQHRTQLAIATLQCTLIIGGTLLSGAFTKLAANIVSDTSYIQHFAVLQFIRYYGVTLLIIPLVWTLLTIRGERRNKPWASTRMNFGSGLIILILLGLLYGNAIFTVVMLGHEL